MLKLDMIMRENINQTCRTGVSTSTKPKDSTVLRISDTIYIINYISKAISIIEYTEIKWAVLGNLFHISIAKQSYTQASMKRYIRGKIEKEKFMLAW